MKIISKAQYIQNHAMKIRHIKHSIIFLISRRLICKINHNTNVRNHKHFSNCSEKILKISLLQSNVLHLKKRSLRVEMSSKFILQILRLITIKNRYKTCRTMSPFKIWSQIQFLLKIKFLNNCNIKKKINFSFKI